ADVEDGLDPGGGLVRVLAAGPAGAARAELDLVDRDEDAGAEVQAVPHRAAGRGRRSSRKATKTQRAAKESSSARSGRTLARATPAITPGTERTPIVIPARR